MRGAINVFQRGTALCDDVFGNTGYSMRIRDLVDEDLNAPLSWWGPGNPAEMIYNGRREQGLGKVQNELYLAEPVSPTLRKAK